MRRCCIARNRLVFEAERVPTDLPHTMRLVLFAAFLLTGNAISTHAANILCLLWYNGGSHFVMYEPLLKELSARGHNVTVLSHFPQKTPVANYHDISLAGSEPLLANKVTMDFILKEFKSSMFGFRVWWQAMLGMCRRVYSQPQVQQLVRSTDHYDLIIVEVFYADCMMAFAHKFRAPLVGMISSMSFPWSLSMVGNPDNPAYIQPYYSPVAPPFSFGQRLLNTLSTIGVKIGYWYYSNLEVDRMIREVFSEDIPPTTELQRNLSLLLINSHWSVNQALPTVPALVQVGGLHIKEPKPLPEELKKFLDDTPQGVIYFSLGSMVRCDSFAPEKMKAILDVFSQLPQRILWKADPATLPPLPGNVRAQNWISQNGVLSHPNVKLFITHAGLMSTLEAVRAGVPMLTIPLFADQPSNAAKVAAKGSALILQYEDITYDTFRAKLDALLNDNRYRERAKQMSVVFSDRPRPPMEEAIYWVEYVLRHKGAPHLRSAAVDLAWYQYLLLDVAAFLVAITVLVVLAVYWLLRRIITFLRPNSTPTHKMKTN